MDSQVELRRLSQLLHVQQSDLGYLEEIPAEGLMQLRRQFQDSLISDFEPVLSKLAATAGLVPVAISEKICSQVLGPTLTSYLAYFVGTKTATKLSPRLKPDFVAEVSKELIPERAKGMLSEFPTDLMRPVTRDLVEQKAWSTMGGFVDHLPYDKTLALMSEVPDPEANLRIASYAQNKALIAEMVTKFDDKTLENLLRASLVEQDLMREVCLVLSELSDKDLEHVTRIREQFSESELQRLRDYAADNGFERLAALY